MVKVDTHRCIGLTPKSVTIPGVVEGCSVLFVEGGPVAWLGFAAPPASALETVEPDGGNAGDSLRVHERMHWEDNFMNTYTHIQACTPCVKHTGTQAHIHFTAYTHVHF